MYTQHNLKHKLLSLWFLIGISLTFGYETQTQRVSVPDVELVEAYTKVTSQSTVSYTQVTKAYIASFYKSSYTTFSFVQFVHAQHTTIQHTLAIQEEKILHTKHSFIKKRLPQRTSLSDDTDNNHSLS
ncbi:hypothetical protein [uncultured Dokdonia sp.]|uniref:hypothetical protein n=1 Tax=uncultured Dokdonia sp. TaxID=575653 RepID=UPI002622394E|nr:hypothetical protein [uncultured Dokdonia sp.]